ncbi:uncharacterized protein TNCV_4086151 [Trichonephila clavipes]|nr:uncharacterized protein TNCV_4086151 [Trichonephila clavipes]
MLGRRIAARPRPPATVRDLEIALLEEWNSIPQSLIDNLIVSMANRYRHPQDTKTSIPFSSDPLPEDPSYVNIAGNEIVDSLARAGAVVPTRRRNLSHSSCHTIDLLKDTFGDSLISRFGPVIWPPRSCDLTPLDYFLWGYVKSLVYADKPQTLDHLEDNIRRVIADIRPQMLEIVIENWTSRLDYI